MKSVVARRRATLPALALLAILPALLATPRTAPAQETFTALKPLSANTADKPQSKVWFHAGHWWTVLPGSGGTWLWRLEADNHWANLLRLSTSTSVRADARALGDVTHILLWNSASTQLVSVEYVPATDSYALWSVRPTATNIALSGSETATIDIDTTGRLWLSTESGSEVRVYTSALPYTSFSGPIVLANSIAADDITVVMALPALVPPQIGVFWSNQSTTLFGFRTHVDGDAPAVWGADERPASQSALHVGAGMADDHMHAAVASDGTLFLAVKTSYNSTSFPLVSLLVRRPAGTWDNLYQVDNIGTRGIVLLNEPADLLRVVYTTDSGGGNILYRDSRISTIGFGARKTLITGSLNNATSTKDTFTDSLVVLASGRGVLITRPPSGPTTTTTSTTSTTSTSSSTTTSLPGQTTTTSTSTTTTTSTTIPASVNAVINADVSVVAGSGTAFGTNPKLEVDNSPVKHTFIQLTVSGTGGHAVTSAVLQLQIATTSGADSDTKGLIHRATCGWSETTLKGTTSPLPVIEPTVLDAPAGAAVPGQVVAFDVTAAVQSDGTFCVAIDSTSTNGVDYNSREASSGRPSITVTVAP